MGRRFDPSLPVFVCDLLLALPYTLAVLFYPYMSRLRLWTTVYDMRLPLDECLPLYPPALLVYVLWVPTLLGVAAFLFFKDRRLYRSYAFSLFASQILAYVCFALFTSAVPRPALSGGMIFEQGLLYLYHMDGPYAACPSLHVATTLLMAGHCHKAKIHASGGYLFLFWCALICLSTLLIRQHVLLDVLGGAILAAVSGWLGAGLRGVYEKRFSS